MAAAAAAAAAGPSKGGEAGGEGLRDTDGGVGIHRRREVKLVPEA